MARFAEDGDFAAEESAEVDFFVGAAVTGAASEAAEFLLEAAGVLAADEFDLDKGAVSDGEADKDEFLSGAGEDELGELEEFAFGEAELEIAGLEAEELSGAAVAGAEVELEAEVEEGSDWRR